MILVEEESNTEVLEEDPKYDEEEGEIVKDPKYDDIY